VEVAEEALIDSIEGVVIEEVVDSEEEEISETIEIIETTETKEITEVIETEMIEMTVTEEMIETWTDTITTTTKIDAMTEWGKSFIHS
jgi:CMP-2-keto-3-deoxyoctulosonic acid synthetase